jgi:hypothetical protein
MQWRMMLLLKSLLLGLAGRPSPRSLWRRF